MASKEQIIEERKANLPLPEQPPVASDWNSADARTVNVGSGGQGNAEDSIRESAPGDSDVRTSGEEWKKNTYGSNTGRQAQDNLGGLPNDAVTREAKDKSSTVDTTKPDYGYPEKSDPTRK